MVMLRGSNIGLSWEEAVSNIEVAKCEYGTYPNIHNA